MAAQTAYGIEAEVEGYPFDKEQMLFMVRSCASLLLDCDTR